MNKQLPAAKIAQNMLTRPEGATMDEIVAETGGGTKYNLLKRLEARGFAIRKVKENNKTRYFARSPASLEFQATITVKGQVTIPQEVREMLGARGGGKVKFVVDDGGRISISPVELSALRLKGLLGKPPRKVTIEEMNEGIRRAAVHRFLRASL